MDDGRQSSDDVAGRADFIRWAMGILLALAALWLDPFGFSTHTAQLSDQILNRLLGDRLLGRTSGDESAITVVLTLDTDARLAGPGQAPAQPSPILPIAVHAEILDRVLAYRPAAVFLDYRFLLDRSAEEKGLERLGEVLTAYAGEENGRRTLLFVVVAPDVLPPLGMSDALAQRFTRLTRSAPNSRRPADDLAPPYPFVVADQHLRPDAQHLYRLAHDLPVLTGVADYRLSPAFAIYRALCRETPSSPDAPDALKALAERSPELCELDGTDPASALRIIWGSSIATPQKDWQRCNEPGWAEVLWRSAFGDAWGARLDCGHQPTLSAAEILTSSESWRDNPCAERQRDERSPGAEPAEGDGPRSKESLASWLCGRVVMIGPLSHTQPDLVLPPTSKPLPGVYWHAMALDNLLHFGDAYKRDVYQLTTGITLPNTLLALAVFLVMAGIAYALAYAKAELHRDRRSQHQQRMRLLVERKGVLAHIVPDLAIATIFVGSHFIVAFAVGWFAFEHLNLAPVNWLGIFVTGVVLPPAVLAMSRSSR